MPCRPSQCEMDDGKMEIAQLGLIRNVIEALLATSASGPGRQA